MSSIIAYYIENMASKEFIKELFSKYGIRYRESHCYSYREYKSVYEDSRVAIPYDEFVQFCRSKWQASPIENYKKVLSSEKLRGHFWHNAMPSMLHYSLQNKVRESISNATPIDDLIEIGRDIMKQEYFMVATHDICESLIIKENGGVLPPTRSKSISDFVFGDIPYDLKVSKYPEDWRNAIPCESDDQKVELVQNLVKRADRLRIRKQAQGSYNGWGANRFYIIVANQDRWINDTDALLSEIMGKVASLCAPMSVEVGGETILVQMVEV